MAHGALSMVNITPLWEIGARTTAPAAGATLVSKTLNSGKKGLIYGYLISMEEANAVLINWTSGGTARVKRIDFSGRGTLKEESKIPENQGLEADPGTTITITVVTVAAALKVYQASLLYAEV